MNEDKLFRTTAWLMNNRNIHVSLCSWGMTVVCEKTERQQWSVTQSCLYFCV